MRIPKKAFSILTVLILFLLYPIFLSSQEKDSSAEDQKHNKEAGKLRRGRDGKAYFTADWRNTELKDFLKGMSAIIKKNILVDESIKGRKITIISQKKVLEEDSYSFLKSVLEAQGFGLIEENELIKVVKLKDSLAKATVVKMGREPLTEEEIKSNKAITQIVPIYQANAVELEPLLKRVTSQDTDIIVYRNTNTLVISGSTGDINKLLKMIDKLDQKVEGPGTISNAGDIHIYTLEHNESEKLTQVLTKLDVPIVESAVPDPSKPATTQRGQKIKAVAHKDSNSVIVTATKEEWQEIQRIIKILDLPRKQILLEVLIVELTSNDLNDFGIDWRVRNEANAQFNSNLAIQGGIIDSKGRPSQVNTLSGFSLGFLRAGSPQIIGVLNANQTNENFNVLSAPQILTMDNQEAEINVGQDVPVRTQSRNAGLGGANAVTVDNYEYRPTGIKLKFTPHINKNDRINLELYQEVKNIAGITTQGTNPTFNKRDIKTTITVDNTQTIVIGGLISNDRQKKVTKIPIFGDIPLLGAFFRRSTTQLVKTNLMVFLTPHILDNRIKADRITAEKRLDQERTEEEREKLLR
ncbi:MAG: type II secretion system protein GspD [Leptospiraceae bacterium]|nr:type II secretion system protein GspD [Leptospiraceae bacterium]MCP5511755.1 type II secretion system protein GspD [Leptospiraceae bacterium]